MHRYRIVTQISLIFSILNLVLAAPIVVQEKHEARGNEMVVAEDVPVAVMPKKRSKLEEAPEGSTSLPPSSPDAMASPQHSSLSDGSTSSGYPTPHLSSASSASGYSWLLDRLPRPSLSPNLPASLYESIFPHSPSSSEIQLPEGLQELAPEMPPSPHLPESPYTSSSSYQASLPSWQGSPPHPPSSGYQGSVISLPASWQESPPHPPSSGYQGSVMSLPASWQESPPHPPSSGYEGSVISPPESWQGSPPHPPSSGYEGSVISPPESWQGSPPHPPSSGHEGSVISPLESWQGSPPHTPSSGYPSQAATVISGPASWQGNEELDSPPERFTPSQHLSSSSADESKSTSYASTSDGSPISHHVSASGRLTPSHNSISEPSEGSPSSPPENEKFLNENMVKKLKIAGAVTIISSIIAGTIGVTHIKHHDHRDS